MQREVRLMLDFRREHFTKNWGLALVPPDNIPVWQYAARNLYFTKKVSSFPGSYDPDFNPLITVALHLLGPNSNVRRLVLSKGTQGGGTLAIGILCAFVADNCPDPIMVVTSDEDERDEYARKIQETMNCSLPLKRKLRSLKNKGKLEIIEIPGTQIFLSTATVARSLRGKHVRYLICSETSNWVRNCQGQGDPFAIADSRTDAYTGREKNYAESTPTDLNSNIEKEGRKCRHKLTLYWACPHCGYYQSPDFFEDIRWDTEEGEEKEPDLNSIYALCQNPACEVKKISEDYKPQMLKNFRLGPIPWYEKEIEEKKLSKHSKKIVRRKLLEEEDLLAFDDLDSLEGSVWLWHNPLQYPLGLKSWSKIVKKYTNALKYPEEMQPVWNNDFGRAYSDNVSYFKSSELMERAENYSRKPLPSGIHALTAGVDVNGTWIALEITGWGRDKESWTVDWIEINEDPTGPVAWQKLDEVLKQQFEHCSGEKIRISATAIDSGHHSQEVANFVRKHMGTGRHIFAIKGARTPGKPIINKTPREDSRGISLTYYYVGTDTAKDTLAARLKVAQPGSGYCHFGSFLPAKYFDEMASEKPVPVKGSFGTRHKWVPVVGKRNEPWDCKVYSLAALEYLLQAVDLDDICDVGEKKYRESGRTDAKTA